MLLDRLRIHLRALFRRGVVEREMQREMQAHIDRATERLAARGMPFDEARAEARREFGNVAYLQEEARDAGGVRWIEELLRDTHYAARGLRAHPAFTFGVVATIGLGVGVNVAMFGIVDRTLFRPPAYLVASSRVHRLYAEDTRANGTRQVVNDFSYPAYRDLRQASRTTDAIAAFAAYRMAVGDGENAGIQRVAFVSASLFDFFDARPPLGRFFDAGEDRPPVGDPVAVLSYAYWQSHYFGRRDVLGSSLRVGRSVYRIIGVAPAGFAGISELDPPAVFAPVTTYTLAGDGPGLDKYGWTWLEIVARRKPGAAVAATNADLSNAFHLSWMQGRETNPASAKRDRVAPAAFIGDLLLSRGPMAGPETKVLRWIAGVALIVLLIATANVANLLLARGMRRRREMSMRRALGASRMRLLRQLFTETTLLAASGTVAGVIAAQITGGGFRLLVSAAADDWSVVRDVRTLAFAVVVGVGVALLAGIIPAMHVDDDDIAGSLRAGMRHAGYRASRTRTLLLIGQTALSVVLLTGAGLFVRSLREVNATPLGYDPEHLVYLEASMRGAPETMESNHALTARLAAAARALPGVTSVTPVVSVPFWASDNRSLFVPGIDSVSRLGRFFVQAGSPDYFRTMNTRITRGRGFSSGDRAGGPLVVVVNEPMAEALWPNEDPIGKCVRLRKPDAPCATVVGVAQRTKSRDITTATEFLYYLPLDQFEQVFGEPMMISLFARVAGRADNFAEPLRGALQRLMPGTSYLNAKPFHRIIDPQTRSWTTGARMFLAFGGMALVLAAIGLYAVIAFGVAQRTQEIGIRLALGAHVGSVLRLVVGDAMRVVLVGTTIGVAVALAAGGAIGSLLYHVSPRDPLSFGAVILSVAVVGVVASVVPALRAARIDPILALRAD